MSRTELGSDKAGQNSRAESGATPLIDRFRELALQDPNALAIWDDRSHALSRNELWNAAVVLCESLRFRGIGPKDIVIIILPNWVDWQVAHLAVRQLGAIPANIPLRTDEKTLTHVIGLVSARGVIGSDVIDGRPAQQVLSSATKTVDHRVDYLTIDADGGTTWADNGHKSPAEKVTDDTLDHLMFTSSSTGMPKAVMHSDASLNAFHDTIVSRFPLQSGDAIFMGSPLGHSVGAIHGARMSIHLGLPLILQQTWDAASALKLIEDHNCAFTAAATPFLKDLLELEHSGEKLGSLRYFLCGGAQVPPGLIVQAQKEFPKTFVTVLWGMTEGGYTTCIPKVTPQDKILNTAGCGSDGLEIRLTAASGQPAPVGTEGNLHVRGPALFYGYYGQPKLTAELFSETGFFDCGDRAVMDEDGYIQITGRTKDIIVRGGVNISPVPIEDVLATHPDVSSVTVIGYPDHRLGERICAVFGPSRAKLELPQVIEFAKEHGLAKQYWPEIVMHIDEMPTTAAGKIRKIDVRAWLAQQVAGAS